MFKSKLSALIDDAVMDCLAYGNGTASIRASDTTVRITAEWVVPEDENAEVTDIEITIQENSIVRFTFTERVPEEYR